MEEKGCRICGKFNEPSERMGFISLFKSDEPLDSIQFIKRELDSWQMNISADDGLPQFICLHCFTKFHGMQTLHNQCKYVQDKFRQADANTGVSAVTMVTSAESYSNQNVILNGTNTVTAAVDDFNFDEMIVDVGNVDDNDLIQISGDDENETSLNDSNLNELRTVDCDNQESEMPEIKTIRSFESLQNACIDNNNIDCEMLMPLNIIATVSWAPLNKELPEANNLINENTNAASESDNNNNGRDKENPNDKDLTTCRYCFSSRNILPIYFQDSNELSQHISAIHNPTFPYTCPHCQLSYSEMTARDTHVRDDHSDLLVCVYCKKRMRSPIEAHQRYCGFIGSWHCDKCSMQFPKCTLARFRAHQRQHEKEKSIQEFKCRLCGIIFDRRGLLLAHQRDHIQNSANIQLKCDECDRAMTNEYELRKHKFHKHNGKSYVCCPYCQKGFLSNIYMERHVRNFHNVEETEDDDHMPTTWKKAKNNAKKSLNLVCKHCNTKFSSKGKLMRHKCISNANNNCDNNSPISTSISSITDTTTTYQCSYCPHFFHEENELNEHVYLFHTQSSAVQSLICDCCNIRWLNSTDFQRHLNDNGIPLFQFNCTECNLLFSTEKHMQEHTINKHSVLVCKLCQMSFVEREKLQNHMMEHMEIEWDMNKEGDTMDRVHQESSPPRNVSEILSTPSLSSSNDNFDSDTNGGSVSVHPGTMMMMNGHHDNNDDENDHNYIQDYYMSSTASENEPEDEHHFA